MFTAIDPACRYQMPSEAISYTSRISDPSGYPIPNELPRNRPSWCRPRRGDEGPEAETGISWRRSGRRRRPRNAYNYRACERVTPVRRHRRHRRLSPSVVAISDHPEAKRDCGNLVMPSSLASASSNRPTDGDPGALAGSAIMPCRSMTSSSSNRGRSVTAGAAGNHFTLELTETLRLAAPMAATQLGQIAMMTTDLAFIGRLGGKLSRRPRWRARSISSVSPSGWG